MTPSRNCEDNTERIKNREKFTDRKTRERGTKKIN
jgi:hypothetical protein